MKSILPKLIICLSLFISFSCSKDSSENLNSVDLLIGTWDFESEHNYDCETNEILIERFSDIEDQDYPGDITFNEDGTFLERDGLEEDGGGNYTGTWEKISETTYRFNYISPETYSYDSEIGEEIIFESNDIIKYDIYGCNENQPNSYDAVRVVRRK